MRLSRLTENSHNIASKQPLGMFLGPLLKFGYCFFVFGRTVGVSDIYSEIVFVLWQTDVCVPRPRLMTKNAEMCGFVEDR